MILALTGIETDRLKEEQQRGISIELGFAYFDLPDDTRVGLIDVPGHERFVHHMIAGATGVDLVLLVVAADEGVMPQTKEHMAICELLGMRSGIVVITKTDLVDDEWLDLVRDDLQDYLATTFLSEAPILEFSSTWKGEQLDRFKEGLYGEIVGISSRLLKATLHRPFMMPVDRVFTIKGFGTVVTGTVQSGLLRVGDTVEILPGGHPTKVRRLENHGQTAEESGAGTRTAANIPDVQRGEVKRGDVLVAPGTVKPLVQFSALLRTVPNLHVELKTQFKALFHTGSAMAEASVRLLDMSRLSGGEEALVAIRLSAPVSMLPGNRFVMRGFSLVAEYGKTLGGGTILWPAGVKARPQSLEMLAKLESGEPSEVIEAIAFLSGLEGAHESAFPYLSDLPADTLTEAVDAGGDTLPVHRLSVLGRAVILHDDFFQQYSRRLLEVVESHHEQYPRQKGIKKEELKSRLPTYLDRELVQAVAEYLVEKGVLAGTELHVSRTGWAPKLDERFRELLRRAGEILAGQRLTPPLKEAMAQQLQVDEKEMGEVLSFLVEAGTAVKASSELYLHSDAVSRARDDLVAFLTSHRSATTQQLKELFGISRKYLIPLAEYFDSIRLTVRVGTSERKLRGR